MKKFLLVLGLLDAAILVGCGKVEHWTSPETGMEFIRIPQMEMWVGKYEVTNAEYRKKESGHDSGEYKGHSLDGERQPVVNVSFEDAKAYARWLTDREGDAIPEGYRYRLPSEEEWVTFAQCGDGRRYPWGDSWPPESGQAGNYADETLKREITDWQWGTISGYNDGWSVSAPVDELWVNPWGLAGVGGNVNEICASDSTGRSFGSWMGGAWHTHSRLFLPCKARVVSPGKFRLTGFGFRLVLSR